MVTIWNFVLNTFESMRMIYLDVINWFNTEFNFGSLGTYTVTDVVFGVGLIALLGFMIAKFIL